MKLYILRWNPNFSMSYEYFDSMKEALKSTEIDDFNWSIYDYEDLEAGDMFILAQVGTGEQDGIAAFGVFNSEPYTASNWKAKDGTNRFYANMDIHCLIDRRSDKVFCAKELESRFPQVDWHRGHAGVLIPQETVEPLVMYLMKNTLPLRKYTNDISFTSFGEEENVYPLAEYFAGYINGLCPGFKKKILDVCSLTFENFNNGEVVDQSLVQISTTMFSVVKIGLGSTDEELARVFVPVA